MQGELSEGAKCNIRCVVAHPEKGRLLRQLRQLRMDIFVDNCFRVAVSHLELPAGSLVCTGQGAPDKVFESGRPGGRICYLNALLDFRILCLKDSLTRRKMLPEVRDCENGLDSLVQSSSETSPMYTVLTSRLSYLKRLHQRFLVVNVSNHHFYPLRHQGFCRIFRKISCYPAYLPGLIF